MIDSRTERTNLSTLLDVFKFIGFLSISAFLPLYLTGLLANEVAETLGYTKGSYGQLLTRGVAGLLTLAVIFTVIYSLGGTSKQGIKNSD